MGRERSKRDLKLGRDVAIKVLPPAFALEPERVRRFEREARVLAALNHPHIAAIHGFEESDQVRGLVLLVEGPTLADRLVSGRLSITESLNIARQLTEALAAAHEPAGGNTLAVTKDDVEHYGPRWSSDSGSLIYCGLFLTTEAPCRN